MNNLRKKIEQILTTYDQKSLTEIIEPTYSSPLEDTQIIEKLQEMDPIAPNTLIVINDADRSTPSVRIIHLLRQIKILQDPVQFIIASGTHKPISIEEAIQLAEAQPEDQIYVHNSIDSEQLQFIGTTTRGTEIVVNKKMIEAEKILTINGVEPHYFAGFTGGIKSLIPGLAAHRTVELNHRWAITSDAAILRTEGNPLFEDLWEAGEIVRPMDQIQTIQLVNHGEDILAIYIGPLRSAFQSAMQDARQIYSRKLNHSFKRIVSFVQEPLNKSLYQAQKAMENVKQVLQDGGTFVLIAQCDSGIGTAAFFERMQKLGTPENILNALSFETYKFGDHKAFYWAQLAHRAELLYLGSLSSTLVEQAFMQKILETDLIILIKTWIDAEDTILIDFAGGYSAVEFENQ